jgi:hypothetical protein
LWSCGPCGARYGIGAAGAGDVSLLYLRHIHTAIPAQMAITAMPPTTPPAIIAPLLLDFASRFGVAVEDVCVEVALEVLDEVEDDVTRERSR